MRRKLLLLQRIGFFGMFVVLLFTTMSLVNSIDHKTVPDKSTVLGKPVPAQKELSNNTTATLFIEDVTVNNNVVNFHYSTIDATTDQLLNIAVVQKETTTEIKAGENKAVIQQNKSVVRSFNSQVLTNKGAGKINLPVTFIPGNYALVLYVQNKKDLSISAAAIKDLK